MCRVPRIRPQLSNRNRVDVLVSTSSSPDSQNFESESTASVRDAQGQSTTSWFTPGVGSIGAASFFSDSGHEIATSLLPTFFTSVLHGTAAGLGIVEGISDALMGVAKLVGGPLANNVERRQRFAVGGYVGTAIATGAIGLATGLWELGVLRAVAWMSRGVRSPSRDALLAQLTPANAYGRAFGVERAGDNLGAVAGPLLAALLVAHIGIRPAIWCAAIPGLFAALAILVAAREARGRPRTPSENRRLQLRALRDARLTSSFIPITLFEFGNVATTLLILRATQLIHVGDRSLVAATSLAILIYAAHNAFAAGVSAIGGRWIDRSGPRVVFGAGALLYVVSYAGFSAGSHSLLFLLIAFVLAGSAIGLSETAESALIARSLPDELRGTGFGVLGGVQALGDVVSSVTVGILYVAISPSVAFMYAAGWMALSLGTSSWLVASRRPARSLK